MPKLNTQPKAKSSRTGDALQHLKVSVGFVQFCGLGRRLRPLLMARKKAITAKEKASVLYPNGRSFILTVLDNSFEAAGIQEGDLLHCEFVTSCTEEEVDLVEGEIAVLNRRDGEPGMFLCRIHREPGDSLRVVPVNKEEPEFRVRRNGIGIQGRVIKIERYLAPTVEQASPQLSA